MSESITPALSLSSPAAEALAQTLAQAQAAGERLATQASNIRLFPEARRLDFSGLTGVRRYRRADRVITVETGLRWGDLLAMTGECGHDAPLTYPPDALLADILAEDRPSLTTGLSGGYPRDLVLGAEIASPDGQLTRSGGEVLKNVTGYDLGKLAIGSGHTLGVITAATLRLRARPQARAAFLLTLEGDDVLSQTLGIQTRLRTLGETLLPASLCACEAFYEPASRRCQLLVALEGFTGLTQDVAGDLYGQLAPQAREAQWLAPEAIGPEPDNEDLTLELVAPLSAVSALLHRCVALLSAAPELAATPPRIQTREAAGLTFVRWSSGATPPPDVFSRLAEPLRVQARACGGDARLTRIPPGFEALAERWNLPADPIVRALYSRLKTACDPHGVLPSGFLPLQALLPPGGPTP